MGTSSAAGCGVFLMIILKLNSSNAQYSLHSYIIIRCHTSLQYITSLLNSATSRWESGLQTCWGRINGGGWDVKRWCALCENITQTRMHSRHGSGGEQKRWVEAVFLNCRCSHHLPLCRIFFPDTWIHMHLQSLIGCDLKSGFWTGACLRYPCVGESRH